MIGFCSRHWHQHQYCPTLSSPSDVTEGPTQLQPNRAVVSSWPKPRANKKVSVEVEKEATDAPEHDDNTFIAAGAETGHSTKKRSSFTTVDASPVVRAGVLSLSTEFSTVPAPLSTVLASKRAKASLSTKATPPLGPQISATPPSESPSASSAGCTHRSVGTRNPGGSRLRPDLSVVTTLAPASDIPLMSATLLCSRIDHLHRPPPLDHLHHPPLLTPYGLQMHLKSSDTPPEKTMC
ncbi:hypothetical protein PM082_023900 [Marasmius tenuissimus]|nr:hypothetical protein PM082_023900 [Marasmius tenuissimus]